MSTVEWFCYYIFGARYWCTADADDDDDAAATRGLMVVLGAAVRQIRSRPCFIAAPRVYGACVLDKVYELM